MGVFDAYYDLRENAVVRPYIQEAVRNTSQRQLLAQLAEKFGPIPAAVADRVHTAPNEQLDRWSLRILRANSCEELLA